MKDKEITIDELLEKIQNKYELAIIAGKMARKELYENHTPKKDVINNVFSKIINEDLEDTK